MADADPYGMVATYDGTANSASEPAAGQLEEEQALSAEHGDDKPSVLSGALLEGTDPEVPLPPNQRLQTAFDPSAFLEEAEADSHDSAQSPERPASPGSAFQPPIKFRVLADSTIRKGPEKEDATNGEHSKGAIIEVVEQKTNAMGLTVYKTITPADGKKKGGWVKLETSKGKLLLERLETHKKTNEWWIRKYNRLASDA